jgi:hypothetical protein
MLIYAAPANHHASAVAILDKEIVKAASFQTRLFELCTLCGARFGIGYFGASNEDIGPAEEMGELPGKLIEILAQDHRHQRDHKGFIELDYR